MNAARLSTRLLTLGILLALASLVLLSPLARGGVRGGQVTFCLGFILLFGYFLGRVLESFHLPTITSYILVGVLCGPFGLNLLSSRVLGGIGRLDDAALAIIALIAGGELRLSILRSRARAFGGVISGQIVCSFAAAVLVTWALRGTLPTLSGARLPEIIAVGLLFGLITVARSPATTIGVVTAMRARGPVTEMLIGVTVLLDVVVLFLAALIIPSAETLVAGSGFDASSVAKIAVEVVGSVGAGLAIGLFVRVYIRWVSGYLPLFLLGLGLIGSEICRHYHVEPLLAFMIAGFFVENYSELGDRLIRGLERSAIPLYVLFFAVSGASIDLSALRSSWLIAVVLVLARVAAFYVGSVGTARATADVREHAHVLWSGYLAQAGVTIGIAALIERTFSWGAEIETIVLAVVAINQLVGPVALRLLIERTGEAGGMDRIAPAD